MALTSGLVNLTIPLKKGSMCQLDVLHSNRVDLYEQADIHWPKIVHR